MSEEIKKWNPEDAISAIKERIQLEFVQMIPPAQFTEMVRSVVENYTTKKEGNYNYRERVSDFEQTVERELQDATKIEVKKLLVSPEWQGKWNGSKSEASDAVKELLAKNGANIINSWLGDAFQQIIQTSQLR